MSEAGIVARLFFAAAAQFCECASAAADCVCATQFAAPRLNKIAAAIVLCKCLGDTAGGCVPAILQKSEQIQR